MAVNTLPVVFNAPTLPSQGFGLYAAATMFDTGELSRELLAGVDLYPHNCDTGIGTYSAALCDPSPATKTPGDRADLQHFDPIVVYAASECRPDQSEVEVMARARQVMALQESLVVESDFASKALAAAGAPDNATSLADAIGMAEEWLGEQGYTGYIHAARRWAVHAGALNAANGTAQLRTNLQNTWVFGGGYASALGNTLLVTGPLFVWRTAVFEQGVVTGSSPTAEEGNTVYALAERVVTVGYECAVHAITISTP
jgi:hypothetical protein